MPAAAGNGAAGPVEYQGDPNGLALARHYCARRSRRRRKILARRSIRTLAKGESLNPDVGHVLGSGAGHRDCLECRSAFRRRLGCRDHPGRRWTAIRHGCSEQITSRAMPPAVRQTILAAGAHLAMDTEGGSAHQGMPSIGYWRGKASKWNHSGCWSGRRRRRPGFDAYLLRTFLTPWPVKRGFAVPDVLVQRAQLESHPQLGRKRQRT